MSKKQIGNYILDKTLGKGTFGKVKLAYHKLTNQRVAIKILEKSKMLDINDAERVTREIHILKLIRHPHVIQLYEIIETNQIIFLVMEYADGGELYSFIKKKQVLSEIEACKIFQELIEGIEYLHKLRIVHRDLKPENLLFGHNNSIKIVDFGLSNTYKKNEMLLTACGSPCYAAPEMIANKPYQSPKVDIWSAGIILYVLLSSSLPFEDNSTTQLYNKILAGKFKPIKGLSNQGQDMINSLLNVNAEERFDFQQIKAHKWFQLNYRRTQINQGLIIGRNILTVDDTIVQYITENYSEVCKNDLVRQVEGNDHSNYTATYYLILKKFLMEGKQSKTDYNSNIFEENLTKQRQFKKSSEQKYIKLIKDDLNSQQASKEVIKQEIKTNLSYTRPPSCQDSRNKNKKRAVNLSSYDINSLLNPNQQKKQQPLTAQTAKENKFSYTNIIKNQNSYDNTYKKMKFNETTNKQKHSSTNYQQNIQKQPKRSNSKNFSLHDENIHNYFAVNKSNKPSGIEIQLKKQKKSFNNVNSINNYISQRTNPMSYISKKLNNTQVQKENNYKNKKQADTRKILSNIINQYNFQEDIKF